MARPSKPVNVIEYEKRSHRTKAELQKRKQEERKLLTGKKIKERKEVKENGVAHSEFLRLKKLLETIQKNDALYEAVINRYALLYAECLDFENKRETFFQRVETLQDEREKLLDEGGMSLPQYFKLLSELQRKVLDLDKQVQAKRKMMLDIEKENIMTIASALRNVPKKEDMEEDPLLLALKGSG